MLAATSTVATCHPNQSSDEFTDAFPRVPVAGPAHSETCGDLFDRALDEGATVVAFPELTGTPSVVDELRTRPAPQPTLVVAGSANSLTGPYRRNRAHLWVARPQGPFPEARPVTVNKRIPYTGALGNEALTETASEITVFVSGPWRFVVGICRDTLDEEATAALVQLGVNLVVVPAASAKTANLAARTGDVATSVPGIALVANGPRWFTAPPGREAVETVGAIYTAPLDFVEPRLSAHVDGGSIWVVDLAHHTAQTIVVK